ncbi:Peptide methionine sulfoxide reductase A4, chloroplastic [Sarracenia purpurea var. burkii]
MLENLLRKAYELAIDGTMKALEKEYLGVIAPLSRCMKKGAKVVLSVVSRINSTIFAYGQTSSGKTYMMSGITEHTVSDIFQYIDRGNDVGTQYRSGIYFYTSKQEKATLESKDRHQKLLNRKIVTEILPAKKFY